MQTTWWRKFSLAALALVMTAVLAACGGGGSNAPNTTTLSGAVTFPASTSQMQKRAADSVVDEGVTIQAYTLNGEPAGLPVKQNSGSIESYAYEIEGLKPGVDYVIKATRRGQVLKKLIDKALVVAGVVGAQTVDAVSTATVVIASERLSKDVLFSLGDVPPASLTVADLSNKIGDINPSMLEISISLAVKGAIGDLNDISAGYANVYNMVVVAVSSPDVGSIDSVLAGTKTISGVLIFDLTNPTIAPEEKPVTAESANAAVSGAEEKYDAPTTDIEKAALYVKDAKAYLAKQDIANASNSFELALASDPNNAEANLGGAITSGLMMLDDPDFKAILARWEVVYPSVTQVVQGTSPIRLPFDNQSSVTIKLSKTAAKAPVAMETTKKVLAAFKTLQATMPKQKAGFKSVAKELGLVPVNAPSISEMQTLIDNVIIPRFDKILARLAKIEGLTNNGFTITKAMQGNPEFGDDVVLGNGEYYTIDAALNIFQALLKISTSYNFNVPSPYTYDTIDEDPLAMINSPSFLTLKSDGVAKMKAALAYAQSATDKAQRAFDILKLREDGVGAFDLTNMTVDEKTDFQASLTDVKKALAGESTIGSDDTKVDFTKFFTNPLTRANLPTFGYDVPRDAALSHKYGNAVAAEHVSEFGTWTTGCSIEPTSDLPDYTLNGILPGNTVANNVAGFNGILPMKSGMLLSNTDLYAYSLTTDGSSIYTHDYSGIWKIDPATGAVTKVATAAPGSYLENLMWYQGSFYSMANQYLQNADGSGYSAVTISKVTIDAGTYSIGSPILVSPTNSWPSAFTVSGTDIYYVLWQGNGSVINKLSSLAPDAAPTKVFETSEWIDSLSASANFLYINGDKYDRAAPTAVLASYEDLYGRILVGGYFYEVDDGKVVKYAGTPAGGVAKSVGSL